MGAQLPVATRGRAQSSSGPRAARGRARPRLLGHGLSVRHVIAFDESAREFRRFYQEITGTLAPQDAVEELMVERIALCTWRLRRIYRIESGWLSRARTSWNEGVPTVTRDIDLVFLRLASHDDELTKLTRYETSLARALEIALRQLYRYQRRRPTSTPKPRLLAGAERS